MVNCATNKPPNSGVSGSSCNAGSGSSSQDPCAVDPCCVSCYTSTQAVTGNKIFTVCDSGRYVLGNDPTTAWASVVADSDYTFRITRGAECGIVIDLTNITAWSISNFKTEVVDTQPGPGFGLGTAPSTSTAINFNFVNNSCYPVYVVGSSACGSKSIEGVSNQIGIRPNEDVRLVFDYSVKGWVVTTHTS